MIWLFSALGIGGGALALVFVPGLLGKALELLNGAVKIAKENPWQAALIVALLALAWQTYKISGKNDHIAALQAEQAVWAQADRLNHKAIDILMAAITDQSKHVRVWAATATAKQKATQEALRALESDTRAAQATSARIRAQAGLAATVDCKTHDAVMQGRNRL